MATVCITGASGFIGNQLCTRLGQLGHNVVAISRKTYDRESTTTSFRTIAVNDYTDFHAPPNSLCIHLAETNIVSQVRDEQLQKQLAVIRSLLLQPFSKIIYASSSAVYGDLALHEHSEDEVIDTSQFASDYQRAKFAAEQLLQADFRPNIILRLANVYGWGMSESSLCMQVLTQLLRKEKFVTVQSLNPVRDYLYISDAVSAFVSAVDTRSSGVLNVASGHAVSVAELCNVIITAFGSEHISPAGTALQSATSVVKISNERLRQQCSWKPGTSLEQGILEMVQMAKAHV